jgi:hypothetical protein
VGRSVEIERLHETHRALGHVSIYISDHRPRPHLPRSCKIFHALQSNLHDILLSALRLDGTGNHNERFMLESVIRDVLVARDWDVNNKLSIHEIKRSMQSLARAMRMLRCDRAALEVLCDTIDSCVNNVDQAQSASHSPKLSFGAFARLLLMRYCQRLCDAVNEPSDVEKAFDKMPKEQNSEIDAQKHLVIKSRRDIYHCSTSSGCISVLVALCAVSSQLRSMGAAYAAAADSCDADVLQLLERMQL